MHKIVSTANTGMRRGEILDLRWGGVDFDTAHLSVTRSLISVGYELHETRGKSRTARRAVNLDPRTIHVLHAWRQLRANEDPEFDRDDPTATSSPAPTEHQLTHNCSRTRSRNSSTDPAFPGFDSTTCHTHAPCYSKPGYRSRSSANDSDTRPPVSPWRPTSTSSHECKSRRRRHSQASSNPAKFYRLLPGRSHGRTSPDATRPWPQHLP